MKWSPSEAVANDDGVYDRRFSFGHSLDAWNDENFVVLNIQIGFFFVHLQVTKYSGFTVTST